MVGIITIEDVIEELIQTEIVDETDKFVDNERLQRVNAALLLRSLPRHLRKCVFNSVTCWKDWICHKGVQHHRDTNLPFLPVQSERVADKRKNGRLVRGSMPRVSPEALMSHAHSHLEALSQPQGSASDDNSRHALFSSLPTACHRTAAWRLCKGRKILWPLV